MRLGLTGGIACGKSTAAAILESMGFGRLDADAIVRDLQQNDPEVQAALKERFGPDIYKTCGQLDRAAVAQQVFADQQQRQWLEALLHPRVQAHWQRHLRTEPDRDWVVEIPLLFENKLEKHFNLTVCVTCHPMTQARRLQARGLTETEARNRITSQMPLKHKVALADRVLCNDGELPFLEAQIQRLIQTWRTSPH
jgi:dephospho-CoA kinase